MVTLPTLRFTRMQKNKWMACDSLHSLQKLLKLTPKKLQAAQMLPVYNSFSIFKKNGKERLIENPNEVLKEIQRTINQYLQAVYYFLKHPASYGFCMAVRNDEFPHNIYTHALQHAGCQYLINADLKDFFHTVSRQRIYDLFEQSPFIHDRESIGFLCNLTTWQNRLPMGAPTSPVLSNLAAGHMDIAMEQLAKRWRFTYTRFVDDLSFSANEPISDSFRNEMLQTIIEHGFEPNMQKVKFYGKNDVKIVTGLQVGEKVSLGGDYWKKVDMLVQQYISLKCLLQNRPSVTLCNQTEEIREKINGFLAFATMIGKEESDEMKKVEDRLDMLDDELEDFESLGWDEIPYSGFIIDYY